MANFPEVSHTASLTIGARPPLATDVPGAVKYTGESRAQLYKDMRAGLLPAHKNGARTIIFYEDLDRYMRALPRARFSPPQTNLEALAGSLRTEARNDER